MPYIVQSKATGRYLVRGKDEWEIYWSENPADATQFKTELAVHSYLSEWQIDKIDILDPSEVAFTKAPLTLGDLEEGKKFQYAVDYYKVTFMKVLQPNLYKFDSVTQSYIGDTDGRHYLHSPLYACWVIILDNSGDAHPQCRVGRIITLNSSVLVREVQ